LRVEIDRPALGAPGLGDEPREHVRRETGEGKEDQREGDVEDRVRVGDLALHVGRRGADEITERADERKEDGDPDELERDVRRGNAARFGVLTDRRERGGRGGPNVRAEDHRDGTLDRHEAGGRERQGETDHRGARAHQPGEDRRKQDEEQRLRGEGAQEIGEERALGERSGPVAHELHPEEEESEAQNGLPDVAPGSATGHEQEPSEEHDERGHLEQVEREKLHGHRGPDVRAEDHPDRLPQREQSRRREADKHHRGRARRLEDRGDAGADEERADTIAGERREDVPKTRAGGALGARAPFASRKVIVANTPCPGRTDVLLIATVRVRPPACVSGCATTFSFSVVSLPARSRATTVMTSGPADAFVESLKEPSGRTITLRPLMVSVAPTSVVPRTTTFAASTVASGWGSGIADCTDASS